MNPPTTHNSFFNHLKIIYYTQNKTKKKPKT